MGQKGYKLYDLENKKTYVSRNLTFIEDVFPFGNNYEINMDIENTNFAKSLHRLQ